MGERMISYAGNHEDVLLNRGFAGQPTGFYVDVGAHHPTVGSTTRHFYDLGWRGVNVEPVPHLARLFPAERPRDVTVQAGLSDRCGTATFYEVAEDRALSTFSEAQAATYRARGLTVTEYPVEILTLAGLLERHAGQTPIDLLLIDVEGHEHQVLAGADFRRWRPRVVVVEATRPYTNEPTHQAWEPVLLAAGYAFALFDGINRFYVREEDPDLLGRLRYPVNVLDRFVPYRERELEQQLEEYLQLSRTARWAARTTQRVVQMVRAVVR